MIFAFTLINLTFCVSPQRTCEILKLERSILNCIVDSIIWVSSSMRISKPSPPYALLTLQLLISYVFFTSNSLNLVFRKQTPLAVIDGLLSHKFIVNILPVLQSLKDFSLAQHMLQELPTFSGNMEELYVYPLQLLEYVLH